MANVSIVIPTYNEGENITTLLSQIQKQFQNKAYNYNVIIVDSYSPDGTKEKAEQFHFVKVISQPLQGLAKAYIDGFSYVLEHEDSEIIIEMDADLSHNPKYIKNLLQEIQYNDMVIGSRYIKGGGTVNWPMHRKIMSKYGSMAMAKILNMPFKDVTGGYRAFKRYVLEQINLETIQSKGYLFQVEVLFRAFKHGFRIKEIPIIFKDRVAGKSKMSLQIALEAIIKTFKIKNYSINNNSNNVIITK